MCDGYVHASMCVHVSILVDGLPHLYLESVRACMYDARGRSPLILTAISAVIRRCLRLRKTMTWRRQERGFRGGSQIPSRLRGGPSRWLLITKGGDTGILVKRKVCGLAFFGRRDTRQELVSVM